MIAFQEKTSVRAARQGWQEGFLQLLPRMERQLRYAFRRLNAEARDEAVQEGIANCLQQFIRLYQQGRTERIYVSSLVRFAVRQINSGRQVACRMNVQDPLSRYAQVLKGIRVERLDHHRRQRGKWISLLVEDRRAPILDQVAARLDIASWLSTLTRKGRAAARDFAYGYTTGEVARKLKLSPGRISQMRNELLASWEDFSGPDAAAPTSSR